MSSAHRTDAVSMADPHSVSLLGLCNDLLRRRWTVAGIVGCCALGSALWRSAQPRAFTSVASFIPDAIQPLRSKDGVVLSFDELRGGRGAARAFPSAALPGPAGSFTSATGPPVQPLDPAYYWRLLRSREILVAVAGSRYSIALPGGARTGTAADIYGLAPGPARGRTEDAARRVARGMVISYSEPTSVITLSVRTFDPVFSRLVTERLLEAVRGHHRRMADARGEAQVAFLTRATAEARGELGVAQDQFARFLRANRAFVAASPLALEYHRRDTDVLEKRRRHADLAVQLARAKLDRSRAMPTISVVQRPETPAEADPRGVIRATITGAVGGIALALLLVSTRAHLGRLRAVRYGALADLETEWRSALYRRAARAQHLGSPAVAAPGLGQDG